MDPLCPLNEMSLFVLRSYWNNYAVSLRAGLPTAVRSLDRFFDEMEARMSMHWQTNPVPGRDFERERWRWRRIHG